jgi:hypothetical protein
VRILKDFKSNEFVSADSKPVTRLILVSADSTGVRVQSGVGERVGEHFDAIRRDFSEYTPKYSMV